ncbi:MAG: hypothetical protein ACREAC_14965 [Blastocatellia bacterium]
MHNTKKAPNPGNREINLSATEHDDGLFIEIVSNILSASARFYRPREVYAVHVDNWFNYKWLDFSGVIFPQVGIWCDPLLRVPPFNPNRIVRENYLRLRNSAGGGYVSQISRPLHVRQPSDQNLGRRISQMSESAIMAWYSGGTASNGRGSLMVYSVSDGSEASWYASFLKLSEWSVNKVKGVSGLELRSLIEPEDTAAITSFGQRRAALNLDQVHFDDIR